MNIYSIFVAMILTVLTFVPAYAEDVTTQATSSAALKKLKAALKSKGASKIPSTSTITRSSTSSLVGSPTLEAVSGTPPQLIDIPGTSVPNLFWTAGVIDAIAGGTATFAQCDQFFSSATDGQSGGLGACQMTEGVGRSFETLLDAETPLCFMRSLATRTNLKAKAIRVVRGKLPEGGITELFSPGATQRLVQINTVPIDEELDKDDQTERLFVRIPSQKANGRRDFLYAVDIYFCPDPRLPPRGFNTVRVADDGEITIQHGNDRDPFAGGASNLMTVTGFLTFQDKSVVWDTTRDREINVQFSSQRENLKANVRVTSADLIFQKIRSAFTQRTRERVRKEYSISRFQGTDITNVRFLAGAYKGVDQFGPKSKTFSGATEYRDSMYVSAPTNSLVSDVNAFDILADSFYQDAVAIDPDTDDYSCSRRADIVINMVDENQTLEQSLEPCLRDEFEKIQFCRDDETVALALDQFHEACAPAPPSPSPSPPPGTPPPGTPPPGPPPGPG